MKDRTRKALENLLGQVVQARDGFGIYQQSKSMDSAVKEAAAALGSQPSAEGDCDECGLAFDNIIHHTTAADDRIRNASHEFVAPSGPKETSVERHLTEHQKQVEEAAGMSLDWPMANAATVATSDLRSKLTALRDKVANGIISGEMRETNKDYDSGATDVEIAVKAALTAILDGKD